MMQSSRFKLYFALIIIIPMVVMSITASWWIPDQAEHANTMHISLATQKPGTSIQQIQLKDGSYYPFDEITIYKESITASRNDIKRTFVKDELYFDNLEDNITQQMFYLGSDRFGRDYLSRLILGSRVSLMAGFISILISLFIGTFFGLLAGYYGGKIDKAIMWIVNVMW